MKADSDAFAASLLKLRQGGMVTANEARAMLGLRKEAFPVTVGGSTAMLPTDLDPNAPEFAPIRADLARLFITHKTEIGAADYSDAEIAERVDDITWELIQSVGRAMVAGNTSFLARFSWVTDAFDRLQADQPALSLDG